MISQLLQGLMVYTAMLHANLFIISVYYIKNVILLLQLIIDHMTFIHLNSQISRQRHPAKKF